MIEVEIIDSKDTEAIGKYRFDYYPIIIGSSSSSDLIIQDEISSKEMVLDVLNSKIAASSLSSPGIFHVNGIKTSGQITIEVGDLLKIGSTSIKILNFLGLQEHPAKINNFDDAIMKAEARTPGIVNLVSILEEELLEREKDA